MARNCTRRSLSLFEGGWAFELFELVGMAVPLVQPGPACSRELVGQVELVDVDETRGREKLPVTQVKRPTEGVGLRHRRVAVDTPCLAEDMSLDVAER